MKNVKKGRKPRIALFFELCYHMGNALRGFWNNVKMYNVKCHYNFAYSEKLCINACWGQENMVSLLY